MPNSQNDEEGLIGLFVTCNMGPIFISSDRSSYSDDGLVYISPLFEIFTQSNDAIDVTSVTLSRLNSINAIDVIRYLGHILGISRAYLGHI